MSHWGRSWTSVVLILAGLFAVLVASAAFQRTQNSSEIRVELYPEGQHTNPAILFFHGEHYEPPLSIPVPLDSPNQPDDIQFLSRMITVSGTGTLEDFLKEWDPRDRESIRKVASDPKLFEGNQNFYRSITASRIVAKVYYGSYEIFYVAHTTPGVKAMVKDYPVTHLGDSLVLTNALQGDPVYAYLSTKYTQMLRLSLERAK